MQRHLHNHLYAACWCQHIVFFCFHSKQRHNKLWRSHSDSDLSDRPESMCRPSSNSLGRSHSHNNNNTSSPSLHHFMAVLQALAAEPEDCGRSLNTHTTESNADSNGVCDPAGQEEVTSDCGNHPLPRPRAATVVPDQRLDNSASMAVTVPVALPHPPPSLHILPPTPELQRARPPACSVPEHKPVELSLNFPERSSSEKVSPLTPDSTDSDLINQSLSDLTSNRHSPLSPTKLTPLPLVLPLVPSDDNNNPSELQTGSPVDSRGDVDGSSNHSADSIDFFSAREKFLSLVQEGSWTSSEQAQQRTPHLLEEETEAKEEEEQGTGTSQVKNCSASSLC